MGHDPENEFDDESVEKLEALYPPEYLRDCADGEAREERLQELRRRIEMNLYDVDSNRIADGLLSRGDLGDD
jgi:anti-sigma28 factor (negative regulator of flagellin synthesis)